MDDVDAARAPASRVTDLERRPEARAETCVSTREAAAMTSDGAAPVLHRFVGVYHADGTLRGELAYWFGKRLGTAHCALCDITHGTFRERRDWQSCRARLSVPFATFHLDDQPAEIRAVSTGSTPAVLADTDQGPILLLGPDELEACGADPDELVRRLDAAVAHLGILVPQL